MTWVSGNFGDFDPGGFGPLATRYLVIEFSSADTVPPAWLRDLPCPIIGLGSETHPTAAACDVIVADDRALSAVVQNIETAPIAAATLVQVLRATETLPLHQALVLESLAYATLQGGVENRAWLASRATPPAPVPDDGPPLRVTRDAATLNLTLNRPAARNAITLALRDALVEALRLAALDDTIGAITLNGAGKCFSVGGALEEFGTAPDQATAHAVRCIAGPAFALAAVAPRVRARVYGACIGAGAELASLCGHVSAHRCSFFQLPEIRMGLLPGSGGTAGFSRRIGRQRAAWLALSGRRVGARQALAWGLVDEIE